MKRSIEILMISKSMKQMLQSDFLLSFPFLLQWCCLYPHFNYPLAHSPHFFSAVTLLCSHNFSPIHCALWLTHFRVPVFSSIPQFSIVIQHTGNWKHGSYHPSTDISPFLSTLCNSKFMCMLSCFSCVWLFETLWTVTHHATLSMGFSRKEYWSGLPCLPPEDLLTQGSNPRLLHLLHFRQILHWATWEAPKFMINHENHIPVSDLLFNLGEESKTFS